MSPPALLGAVTFSGAALPGLPVRSLSRGQSARQMHATGRKVRIRQCLRIAGGSTIHVSCPLPPPGFSGIFSVVSYIFLPLPFRSARRQSSRLCPSASCEPLCRARPVLHAVRSAEQAQSCMLCGVPSRPSPTCCAVCHGCRAAGPLQDCRAVGQQSCRAAAGLQGCAAAAGVQDCGRTAGPGLQGCCRTAGLLQGCRAAGLQAAGLLQGCRTTAGLQGQGRCRAAGLLQAKHCKACKSMEKYGKAWKSMEKHGKAWKSMERHEKAWKSMETSVKHAVL